MENSPSKNAQILSRELRESVGKFKLEAKELFARFNSEHQRPASSKLYHYTTDVGLYGILQSGSLWLTDVFSMNDPSELRYGISLALGVLKSKRPLESEMNDRAFGVLEKVLPETGHFFSCSFSREGDDLGQWRAYADDARGYSIEFDGVSLETAFENSAGGSKYFRPSSFLVSYEKIDLLNAYEQLIERMPSIEDMALKSLPLDQSFEFWTQLFQVFLTRIMALSLYFKHPAYKNEDEHRLLEIGQPSLHPPLLFRPRAHELIKYSEFGWRSAGEDVLKKIVIGPSADYERARAFAQRCLDDFGFKNVEIIRSDIPYRSCNSRPK